MALVGVTVISNVTAGVRRRLMAPFQGLEGFRGIFLGRCPRLSLWAPLGHLEEPAGADDYSGYRFAAAGAGFCGLSAWWGLPPLPGRWSIIMLDRWLTPPANVRQASGLCGGIGGARYKAIVSGRWQVSAAQVETHMITSTPAVNAI